MEPFSHHPLRARIRHLEQLFLPRSPCPADSLILAGRGNIWARGSQAQLDSGQRAEAPVGRHMGETQDLAGGLGSGGQKDPPPGSLGHAQVCRKRILTTARVVCQARWRTRLLLWNWGAVRKPGLKDGTSSRPLRLGWPHWGAGPGSWPPQPASPELGCCLGASVTGLP